MADNKSLVVIENGVFSSAIFSGILKNENFSWGGSEEFQELVRVCENSDSEMRTKLLDIIHQLSVLLDEGENVYSSSRKELDSWMRATFVFERVGKIGMLFKKTVAKFSLEELSADSQAQYQIIGKPSVFLYYNTIKIINENSQNFGFINQNDFMLANELNLFFLQKQSISDEIRNYKSKAELKNNAKYLDAINLDKHMILDIFRTITENPSKSIYPICRRSHPYMQPIIHILPRLLFRNDTDHSALELIKNSISQIKSMGFSIMMLGLTDKQTTNIYYGENDAGELIAFVNNHGYWSSGEPGVDPVLGTEKEYIELVQRIRENGGSLMQDVVFGSMGYPAQIDRFALSQLNNPTKCLMVGNREVPIFDHRVFLHETCISEEESLSETVAADTYANVLHQSHIGSPFALPKPNLFLPDVLKNVLQRTFWQVRNAGICTFRIDMAKHIGVAQLREIISELREECKKRSEFSDTKESQFRVLLEYWTTKNRDLKFAMSLLGDESERVYFYDFPLAQALQDIFIKNMDFYETIVNLQKDRIHWGINLYQMIPTFIDHDFSFRPIYNGDSSTRSIVVVGYAMCAMLSANAPYVYFGYDKAEAGAPDIRNYCQYTEAFSRQMVAEIFASSDENSPANSIAELLVVLRENKIFSNWSEVNNKISGDMYSATLTRSYFDEITSENVIVEASFSRFYQPEVALDGWSVLFAHCHGPSVILRKRTAKV